MGRIAIRISNGSLIEYQSTDAPTGTLTANAISSGLLPEDIDEHYITDDEYRLYRKTHPPALAFIL